MGDDSEVIEVYVDPEDYGFDERFDLLLLSNDEPLIRLKERLRNLRQVLTLEGGVAAKSLAEKLVFVGVVTALEAFLCETVNYWVEHDEKALRNIVTKILKDKTLKLGEIFTKHAGIKGYVKGYLQNSVVWHRWKTVEPLLKLGLEIGPPSFKSFEEILRKRHDIVHRSGHDKLGNPVSVTRDEIDKLCEMTKEFAVEVHSKLGPDI